MCGASSACEAFVQIVPVEHAPARAREARGGVASLAREVCLRARVLLEALVDKLNPVARLDEARAPFLELVGQPFGLRLFERAARAHARAHERNRLSQNVPVGAQVCERRERAVAGDYLHVGLCLLDYLGDVALQPLDAPAVLNVHEGEAAREADGAPGDNV